MKISVKILFGDERPFEVSSDMSVLDLKQMVNAQCKIPIESQKLLLNGRALVDSKLLVEYNIEEGTKINVFVCRPSEPQNSNPARPSLHLLLYNKFRLFFSDEDSLRVADEFMRDFYAKMAALSLDDIERLATQYMEEDMANAAETETGKDTDGVDN